MTRLDKIIPSITTKKLRNAAIILMIIAGTALFILIIILAALIRAPGAGVVANVVWRIVFISALPIARAIILKRPRLGGILIIVFSLMVITWSAYSISLRSFTDGGFYDPRYSVSRVIVNLMLGFSTLLFVGALLKTLLDWKAMIAITTERLRRGAIILMLITGTALFILTIILAAISSTPSVGVAANVVWRIVFISAIPIAGVITWKRPITGDILLIIFSLLFIAWRAHGLSLESGGNTMFDFGRYSVGREISNLILGFSTLLFVGALLKTLLDWLELPNNMQSE